MIRQVTCRTDLSEFAYVFMPGTTGYDGCFSELSAAPRKNIIRASSETFFNTRDGWIYKDWQLLLPGNNWTNLSAHSDGIWRYESGSERYPLLCRPVSWAELELLHTFR